MSARIAGVNLPDNKRIVIGLTTINGIGKSLSEKLLKEADIDVQKRGKDLTEEEVNRIRQIIDKQGSLLEGELARSVHANIKRLREIGTWRGMRHAKHMPVRGQRTKTNSRTVRGNIRKTTTSGKKPAAQKT
ncbi:30S ribosomal protein S13 [bacterium]|jgi:small subunit ribosomal protein S13|nr:30S ribosomal protein S13 [bacterium]MDP6756170.1 30S ribosomal protein S13 [Patescibacteria group bacterium]|tara:strand:- start:52208 stop:52603 length:396 start_codon:yes stop_codon:yes gene_type:complete